MKKMCRSGFLKKASLVLLSSALANATGFCASTDTWLGSTASSGIYNWSTSANWTFSSGTGPVANTDSLIFSGLGSTSVSNDLSALNINGLSFNSSAQAYTLTGNAITISAGITDSSTHLETINLPLAFSTSHSVNVGSGGSLTINSVVSGTGGYILSKTGPGSLTLTGNQGANTYGPTTISGGALNLNFATGGSTPTANLVANAALNLSGGTLTIQGNAGAANSQSFTATTFPAASTTLPGQNIITATNGVGGTATLNLGGLTLNSGSSLVFNGPATTNGVGNVAATGVITTTTAGQGPTTAGIYGILAGAAANNSYATVGLYDWASTDLAGGTAGTSPYTILGGSQIPGFYVVLANNANPGLTSNSNLDIVTQQTPVLGGTSNVRISSTGNTLLDSIRFNSGHAPYITVKGGNFMQVGGVLVTPSMGNINCGIDEIRLASTASQLIQNNTSGVFCLGVNGVAPIFSNGSSVAEAYVISGPGAVFINPGAPMNIVFNYLNASSVVTTSSSATYNSTQAGSSTWGAFYINGGITVINNANVLGNPTGIQPTTAGGGGTVNLNGGTLMAAYTTANAGVVNLINAAATGSASRPVFLGGNGGGLAAQSNTVFTVGGAIASASGTGPLTIGIPASSANGNVVGLVPGTGGTTANPAFNATGLVILTNANSYYGGTVLQSGTLNINGINALGGANYGGLTFNGGTLQYATAFAGNGSGDLTSVGTAGLTMSAGGGTIDLNGNTITYAGSIGNNGAGSLTVTNSITGGSLNLSGANTYTGNTTNNGVTLNIAGSILGNVLVNNGGTNGGSGTIGGNVTVNSGGQTYPGSSGATNTIAGNLTYNTGAGANFYLTSSATGNGNDQIVLNGVSSILNGNAIPVGINCGSVLDQAHDYLLFKLTGGSATIATGFNTTPVWLGTTPGGAANFSIMVTNGTQVVLHYAGAAPPTITAASATPNPVLANQIVFISATVVPGSGAINPNTGVTVNLTAIGGASTQALIYNGTGNYTNSVAVNQATIPGNQTLAITATDSNGGSGLFNIVLMVSASSQTWNGADVATSSNWSDGLNWVSGLAPGFGDNLSFAGGTGLSPVMDNSYNLNSVTFSSGANNFNLLNSGGSVLTLVSGLTNNSTAMQTLSLPVVLGTAVTVNAAAGNLVLAGTISGSGTLTTTGPNTTTISGVNTYSGNTTISSSTLTIGGAGQLGSGVYAGNITNNATLTYNSTAPQTWSGTISGTGALNQNGSGSLTLTASNTFSGTTVIAGNMLVLGNASALQGSTLNYNNQGGQLGFGTQTTATLGGLTGAQNLNLVNASSAAVTLTINNAMTAYSGNLSDNGVGSSVVFPGAGTNILVGTNSYAGATTIYNGTLQLNPGAILGGSSLNVGTSSGSGGLHLIGGNLTNGGLNLGTGTLFGTGNVVIDSGTALFTNITFGNVQNGGSLTVNGGNVSLGAVNDRRDASVNGAASYNAGLILNGGTATATSVVVSSSNSGGNLTMSNGLFTIGNAATTGGFQVGAGTSTSRGGFLSVFGGALTYNGTDGLLVNNAVAGAGTVLFNGGVSTLTGITLNKIGSTAGGSILTINGTAAVYLGAIGLVTNAGVATATINLNGGVLGASTNWSSLVPLTLGGTLFKAADSLGNPWNITLNGVLAGTSLVKSGAGILSLNAANTYTGTTTVSNGTLLVNGSIGNGVVTVTNATLGGVGVIGGATTLQPNAILAAGSKNIGTLHFGGALTLNSLSTNTFAVTPLGGVSNNVVVAGLLTPNGSAVTITSGTTLLPGTYPLFTYGSISGSFNVLPLFDTPPVHPSSTIVDNGSGQINLLVPNQAPTASGFLIGAAIGTPTTIPIINGKYAPSDADGDVLSVIGVSGSTNGTVTTDGTNITYTATSGVADSFTYTVSDGYGGTSNGTVSVTINSTGQSYNQVSAQSIGGNAVLSYLGIPGYPYALEWTHSLSSPVIWTPLLTNAAAGNGSLLFTNTPSGGSDFYRTRYAP